MNVRHFSKEDVIPVLVIQAKCPQAARWVEADYLRLADDPGGLILVAERETARPPMPWYPSADGCRATPGGLRRAYRPACGTADAPELWRRPTARGLWKFVEASRRLWAAGRSALGLPAQAGREAATSPKVVGFAALHRAIDEVELRNIAVDPEHQHQGVGKALLKEAWQRLVEAGAKRVFLEVRASNNGALQFYYSLGFALYSRRNNYYSDPAEDAFVLALGLSPQAQRRPLRLHRGQPVAGQASCGPGFHSGE